MKNLFFFWLAIILSLHAYSQPYWQQHIAYKIDVALNDKENILDGFEHLVYTNHSPDTLRFIWFHLWSNAYKNDQTAFSDQMLRNGDTRFYFAPKEQRGYINRLDLKVNGTTARTEDHPQHIDIIKLLLPKPLPPRDSVVITTPFHVKLPYNFSRGGYDGKTFLATQWFPKPAVYDRAGWHPMPYLDQGEFYSEFGSFDVRITVPKSYVVAATGQLKNEGETEWLKTRSTFTWPPTEKITATKKRPVGGRTAPPGVKKRAPAALATPALQETKTLHFQQDSIHDFAWFANRDFIVQTDTLQAPSGRVIKISSFYTPSHQQEWQPSVAYAKAALRFYNTEVGEYPYNVVSIVQGPKSVSGGMEYPTITVLEPALPKKMLDATIAHEIGHNWFYGILASNERMHPWMDEGINSYYEKKYVQQRYRLPSQETTVLFHRKAFNQTDQPVTLHSDSFSKMNYALSAYEKAARWLQLVEKKTGRQIFQQRMRQYYQQWRFKHPQPNDFFSIIIPNTNDSTEAFFTPLQQKGVLPGDALTGTTVLFPLSKKAWQRFSEAPTKNLLAVSPAVGGNSYDKLMIGGLFTNYGSPAARFNFLAVPFYATGSHSITGLGKLNYRLFPGGAVRRADLFLNASSFHMNSFTDSAGNDYRMRFAKLVPGVRFTFREKKPTSPVTRYVQWKTFLFKEQRLQVGTDTLFGTTDTVVQYRYSLPTTGRYLNQLQLAYQNHRVLYPFDAVLQIEQAQDFIRTSFTGHYLFNYAKCGGLLLRLFAGKFSYLNGKTTRKEFSNDRYQLNLTGANGYEDYTYSDYFVGRNRFSAWPSQQIMLRDGAFKVRTDLLSDKVGKTDNWLTALNLVSTVPDQFNPLSILPFKIPVRVFADIGTYAEAWNRNNETDRFLYDAGLQFSVWHETVNIYVPLLYSAVYRNYFKSTLAENRFLKTISFSINLNNNLVQKVNREWEF